MYCSSCDCTIFSISVILCVTWLVCESETETTLLLTVTVINLHVTNTDVFEKVNRQSVLNVVLSTVMF